MTLISWISGTMTRTIIGIVGASKIRQQLRAIKLFVLPLSARLKYALCFNITNEAFPDQAIVIDLKSDTSASFSSVSTYMRNEVESILGDVDENIAVCAA